MEINDVQRKAVQTEEDLFKQAILENDLIFVGSVVSVGDPPAYWSGYFPAYQIVRYKVEKVIKGTWSEPEITVDHVVVQNSKTAEAGDSPGLSSKLFIPRARFIVFAVKANDGTWKNLHQQHGVYPFSDDLVARIVKFL